MTHYDLLIKKVLSYKHIEMGPIQIYNYRNTGVPSLFGKDEILGTL